MTLCSPMAEATDLKSFKSECGEINRCKTCKWWQMPLECDYWGDNDLAAPKQWPAGTFLPVEFEVRYCNNPHILFCERPLKRNAASVADGSAYMANLYTAEDFGCPLHEAGIPSMKERNRNNDLEQ